VSADVLCECGCGEPAPIATKTSTTQGYRKGVPMRFVSGHNSRNRPVAPEPPAKLCECGCGEPAPISKKTLHARGQVKGQPVRFIHGHAARVKGLKKRVPEMTPCGCGCGELVRGKFANGHNARRGPIDYLEEDRGYETPCWVWQRFINPAGYGMKRVGPATRLAHRVYYVARFGAVPEGLELDHLCRVRACVNPDHLEPVTKRVNILRGEGTGAKYARRTHCAQGHPLSGDNLYIRPINGARVCLACKRARKVT
jgi:hypothetical protein